MQYIVTFPCPDTGTQIVDYVSGSCVEDVQRATLNYWNLPYLYPIQITRSHGNKSIKTVQESIKESGESELPSMWRNWTSSN